VRIIIRRKLMALTKGRALFIAHCQHTILNGIIADLAPTRITGELRRSSLDDNGLDLVLGLSRLGRHRCRVSKSPGLHPALAQGIKPTHLLVLRAKWNDIAFGGRPSIAAIPAFASPRGRLAPDRERLVNRNAFFRNEAQLESDPLQISLTNRR